MNEKLNISGIVNDSIVDGPGLRYTIFTQGCYHNCEGCHNPQTHDPHKGKLVDIETFIEDIRKNPLLDGVTFSGGEPFLQAGVLGTLGLKIKDEFPNMNIVTYTGYTFEEILKHINNGSLDYAKLLGITDLLIDGRFDITKKSLDIKFRGSSNQRILLAQESFKESRAVDVSNNYDECEKEILK